MKRRGTTLGLLIAAVGAAGPVGCEKLATDGPTGPLSPAALANTSANPVVLRVTTGGADVSFTGNDGFQHRVSFTAERRADGTADGRFEASIRTANVGTTWSGVVTCVTRELLFPNRAHMAGFVLHTNQNAVPGPEDPQPGFEGFHISVEDNGEGNSPAGPDRTFGITTGPPAATQALCETFGAGHSHPFYFPIESGNVQIHDPTL